MPTAVVIDGAYFIRRFNSSFPRLDKNDPKQLAMAVSWLAGWHVSVRLNASPIIQAVGVSAEFAAELALHETTELYRIFFYDCPPLTKRMHRPVSGRSINWGQTEDAKTRTALHEQLNATRKVALRLGRLSEEFARWKPRPQSVQTWLQNPSAFVPSDEDFELDITQKGVDMRLGLDIAAMAFKHQIDQLVMVTGDADFVPPAKLARREGIDVVLDPMHGPVARDLAQHVDGIRNCLIDIPLMTIPNSDA